MLAHKGLMFAKNYLSILAPEVLVTADLNQGSLLQMIKNGNIKKHQQQNLKLLLYFLGP